MGKSALILGASGLTGSYLLDRLLQSDQFQLVRALVRSPLGEEHSKLEEIKADMFDLKAVEELFQVDVVFCCIGTTKAKTPDKSMYMKIDKGIPEEAAKLSAKHGVPQFVVISAMGADAKSSIFYNRVKGEMEVSVLAQDIPHIHVLRPSLIGGQRQEKRGGEKIAQIFMGTFSWLVPANYKMIHPATIAQAMLNLALRPGDQKIYTSGEISQLATHGS
ncbi:NAD(P)H-binding protein [Aureitalea marina]|uniref:NAD(P)-binding domain-containing protein n=1 Tax=Aureitalea marina TaxID=930804 RepID=A0A2S7KRY8_9FLAO|nr:NAD(P)H-binding protein [Aureitalea marina]PQB05348.1 hypothetical protein BST85_10970 [Aureitalea marina]